MSELAKRLENLPADKRALLEARLQSIVAQSAQPRTAIPRRADAAPCPLSFSQEQLWLLDQIQPGSAAYNISETLRLDGLLDVAALERALNEVVRRHEALRTVFRTADGVAVQVIQPHKSEWLPVTNLEGAPASDRETEARQLANEEARRPFDLANGPLLRVRLLRLNERLHFLLLNLHHIVSDGWSGGIFNREVIELYQGFTSGQSVTLPELPIQYADFAVWQRALAKEGVFESELTYWKRQLSGAPPLLELPTDYPRPAIQSFRGDFRTFKLGPQLSAAVMALSKREKVTPFVTLLAAFNTLLHRYSGQTDILVGTPVANRNREELENLIGYFVNVVILRTGLEGEPTFNEVLRRVRELTLGAFSHQELPFETLVKELRPVRDPSYNPMFQVMFALQSAPEERVKISGLEMTSSPGEAKAARFDLTLFMFEGPEGFHGTLEFNTDLFAAKSIERMLLHFQTLLTGAVNAPEQRLWELPLLPASERHQIVDEWNATGVAYPRARCLHQLFEMQAAQTPLQVAVEYEGQRLTYSELNTRANQLAHHLQELGVKPDGLVGVCVERSLNMVVAVLGILKAGGAYVPLDPYYPVERLAFMLEDTQLAVLVTDALSRGQLPPTQARLVCLDRDWPAMENANAVNPAAGATAEHLAYVIYTSGSTGRPKGVLLSHRNAVNVLTAVAREPGFTEHDTMLAVTTLSFDISLAELFLPLSTGGRLVIVDREVAADGRELRQRLETSGATFLQPTPATWRLLLASDWTGSPKLKMISTGEALPRDLAAQLLPLGESLWNLYGPTETAIWSTGGRVISVDEPVLIGRPIANTQIYILDSHSQPVPVGVAGELHIGGDGVARGYLNRPELTAEKFVRNPFSPDPQARLYKTGDLARYRADGRIECLGRIDHQIKLRGFRVELGEIETLLGRHPAVGQSVVVVREDVPGEKRLVAYVVARGEQALVAADLRAALKEALPEYMVPSAFVFLARLPLNANGKVDRRALPLPEGPLIEAGGYVAPRTPVEQAVAKIWEEVLQVKPVGSENNFFDLGGHSLLATRVVSRINKVFRATLPIRSLFENPTVAGLAEAIRKLEPTPGITGNFTGEGISSFAGQVIPRRSRSENLPLSFAQQRLWFLDRFEEGGATYDLPEAWRLRGHLDVRAFEQSLAGIVRRHEPLRTIFPMEEGAPVQIIQPPEAVQYSLFDLSDVPEAERTVQLKQHVADNQNWCFDLARGPVLRSVLIKLGPDEYVWLLNVHHIASDAWSSAIFHRELAALYEAALNGQPLALEPLPIQYADFAIWQREWLSGAVLEKQLAYWKQQLAELPPVLELPTDRPRPAVPSLRGAVVEFQLGVELTERLKRLAKEEQATLFMVLLGGFQALLHRYSHQPQVTVGTPIAGRNRAETEGLIGFFVNTLVLRGDLRGDPTVREFVRRTRETALGAYEHQDLPFERLVEALRPERARSHHPIFQVMFALQNAAEDSPHLAGITAEPVAAENTTAKFDLSLGLVEGPAGLGGWWEYGTDLFDASTIERWSEHFRALLEAMVAHPERRVSQLNLLPASERHQIVDEWNATGVAYPRARCLHQLFEMQAAQTPLQVAVEYEGQRLTYSELNTRANQLAHHLQELGVKPDGLVGVCVERSLNMVVAVLGILKAGGAYVPLDPYYPVERLAFMLEDTQLAVLVTDALSRGQLPPTQARLVCLDRDWPAMENANAVNPAAGATAEHLAYVIYTSGSTGRPKGVLLSHRNAVNVLTAVAREPGFTEHDTMLAVTTLSFDISLAELFLPLSTGGRLVIVDREVAADGRELRQRLETSGATFLQPTPATWRLLLASDWTGSPKLKMISTGEALPRDLAAQLLPLGESLWNLYGPTETAIWSTGGRVISVDEPVLIGRPIANTQIYILDSHSQPVPVGVAGELHIGGDGVARGYLNRPELTAEKFVRNPFSPDPQARLYKTGDLARYRADGRIECLGRIDHQIKLRGFRVELGEIETLLGRHPAVGQSVVVVREDVPGEKRLVAYVVARGEQALVAADLRAALKEALPEYMVPSAFVFLLDSP